MEKMVSAFEARQQLGKILEAVSGRGERYVVEYHGEPVAAVVPIALYERWKRRREAFFDQLEARTARADVTEEEGGALAAESVRAVRHARS